MFLRKIVFFLVQFGFVCERGRRKGLVWRRRTHLRSGRRRSGARSAKNALEEPALLYGPPSPRQSLRLFSHTQFQITAGRNRPELFPVVLTEFGKKLPV